MQLTPNFKPARFQRAGFFSLACALLLPRAIAQAPPDIAENTGPNKNIVGRSSGVLSRSGIVEYWQVIEHTDGSNTWLIWRADARAGRQVDALFRTGATGLPLAGHIRQKPRGAAATVETVHDAWPASARGLLSWPMLQNRPAASAYPAETSKPVSRRPQLSARQLTAAGIARWAAGRYTYTTLRDARVRGREDFYLTVHNDNSRSITMWHDIFARHSQFSVSLHVDPTQRPLEAFASYWTTAGYKGATHMNVDGARLSANYRGPAGNQAQTLNVPARFSIGTHPVSADGWHTVSCDDYRDSEGNVQVYTMEASADLQKPMFGQLTKLRCEPMGNEIITVPAGTFDTLRYRLAGVSDVWITRQDRLMVKFVSERLDRAYSLIEFYAEGFSQNQLRK